MSKRNRRISTRQSITRGWARLPWILAGCCLVAASAIFSGCGQSPHDIVARGSLEPLAAMLDAEPDRVHERNALGKTPLHYAVSYRQLDGITLLLERGADINDQDNTGMTPLHVAAMLGRLEVATNLLEQDADVLLEDIFGNTPLHLAAIHGHGQMAPLFARASVPLEQPNAAGKTPLDLAAKHGHARLAQMLAARMGVPAPEMPEFASLVGNQDDTLPGDSRIDESN